MVVFPRPTENVEAGLVLLNLSTWDEMLLSCNMYRGVYQSEANVVHVSFGRIHV